MFVGKSSNFFSENKYGGEDTKREVDSDLSQLFQAIQGRLRFGSGTSGAKGENIGGVWVQFLTSGTALFETSVSHKLGSQPMGYIIIWQDKAGNLLANPLGGANTIWTSGTAYFRCSGTSVNFMTFLLERGGQ